MPIKQNQLRIAHFTDSFYPKMDGIVTFLDNFIGYFSKIGYKIAVFCPTYKNEKEKYFGRNVKIFRLKSLSLRAYKEVKISMARPKTILSQLREFKPDIIHIHTPGPVGILGIMASRRLNVPLIGTYHTLVSEQTGYLFPGGMLGLNKLASMAYQIFLRGKSRKIKEGSILKNIIWKASLKIYKKCEVIIAPSKSIAHLLKRSLKRSIIYVCCGIDLKKFHPKKKYAKAKKLSFLWVGRLSFEKNIDIIIKAFHILDKKGCSDFSLSIVGGGPAKSHLENMAKMYGLESKIHFIGELQGYKLRKIYRKSDVFVTASAMETLGMTILEALASGIPVIAVRKYAVPDIVKDGVNGYLADPYDASSFSEAIIKIARNRSKIPRFGKNGACGLRSLELGVSMRKLETVYINALSSKNSK